MVLDWCQKLVFAQCLENGWTEFDQICIYIIIDKLYVCNVYCLFLCKFAIELRPLIDVRNRFLLNILRMDGQNLNKLCIRIIIVQNLIRFCTSILKIFIKNQFLTVIKGCNSASLGPIWPKFELCPDLLVVLITWKNEEDPIKNVGARVFTTIFQTHKGR